MHDSHLKFIRNFSIISHINHGKSTLADRLIEITQKRTEEKLEKIMDSLELEKERGITIKLNTARLNYDYKGDNYQLNLIDTPGHVDFAYEVSRSLAACEGVILLVDAVQGIQAQTISNLNKAQKKNLTIIPAINKIDLKYHEIEKVKDEIEMLLNIDREEILLISAKNNIGIEQLIAKIIEKIPAPIGNELNNLQALIFDAYYDRYQGVILFVRLMNGNLQKNQKIKFFQSQKTYEVIDLWIKKPELEKVKELKNGEVGLIQLGIKNMSNAQIGDTIINFDDEKTLPIRTNKKMNPVVFANFFASNNENFINLERAIKTLNLNDCSFTWQKTNSSVFGQGFYCGFLGLLHLEIVRDRIAREENVDVIVTTPSVKYKILCKDGKIIYGGNSKTIPDFSKIKLIEEPIANVKIWTPIQYLGEILKLIKTRRGDVLGQEIVTQKNVEISTDIPLAEIVIDFFDFLKSISNGYASFQYEVGPFKPNKLVKLEILVNGKTVDAFFQIVAELNSYRIGRVICQKLKKLIPRQNFKISIQAAMNGKIIAREDISALQKSVADKCYGGDITRKQKLWKKQKKGKLKMKKFGNVEIPNKIFIQVLKK